MCVHVPRSLKSLDGLIACCLLELFIYFYFLENVDCFVGMNVCVTCWDEIFIIGCNLQACMCWGWESCLNTSHQYHFSALPLTGISVTSEEITVLNCPSCIFMLVYYNGDRQNELSITKLTCNANRQNDFFWYNQLKYDTANLRNYGMTAYLHNGCPQTNVIISDYVNLFVITWWKSWRVLLLKGNSTPRYTYYVTCHQYDRKWWVTALSF